MKKLMSGLSTVLLIFVAPIAVPLIWFEITGDKRPYNPDVFPAFRRIEAYCSSLDFESLTVRCESVNKSAESCHRSNDGCTADEVYRLYTRLMFDLPPLKLGELR